MAKLSLVDRALVDKDGVDARETSDMAQLGLTESDLKGIDPERGLEGLMDLGLVEYQGVEYYAAIYRRPITEEDLTDDEVVED